MLFTDEEYGMREKECWRKRMMAPFIGVGGANY